MAVIDIASKLETTECCTCGIEFATPMWWLKTRRESKEQFFCPNGHPLSFKINVVDGLRASLAAAENARRLAEQARDAAERRARDARAASVRARKRCAASLCPVPGCKRSFATTRLQRHMKSKHPGWKASPEAVPGASREEG